MANSQHHIILRIKWNTFAHALACICFGLAFTALTIMTLPFYSALFRFYLQLLFSFHFSLPFCCCCCGGGVVAAGSIADFGWCSWFLCFLLFFTEKEKCCLVLKFVNRSSKEKYHQWPASCCYQLLLLPLLVAGVVVVGFIYYIILGAFLWNLPNFKAFLGTHFANEEINWNKVYDTLQISTVNTRALRAIRPPLQLLYITNIITYYTSSPAAFRTSVSLEKMAMKFIGYVQKRTKENCVPKSICPKETKKIRSGNETWKQCERRAAYLLDAIYEQFLFSGTEQMLQTTNTEDIPWTTFPIFLFCNFLDMTNRPYKHPL